jgi:hypothetical protein
VRCTPLSHALQSMLLHRAGWSCLRIDVRTAWARCQAQSIQPRFQKCSVLSLVITFMPQKPIQLLHSTQAVLLTTGIEVCVEAREHVCDKMLSHLGKSSGRLACTDHTGVNAYTSRECIHSDLAIRRRAQYPTRRLPNFLCLHGVSSFIHYFLST